MNQLVIGIVYKRTSPSGKVYIGQTYNEKERTNRWFNLEKVYSGGVIDTARKKYAPETWKYEILYTLVIDDKSKAKEILNIVETYYIKFFKSRDRKFGYNMNSGGDSSSINRFSPIMIFDLHTKEELYYFDSKEEGNLFFGVELIRDDKLNRKYYTKNKLHQYNPPVTLLPDGRPVLMYKEKDDITSLIDYDREQALSISKYKKVVEINTITGEIKEWNSSREAEIYNNLDISSQRTVNNRIRRFETYGSIIDNSIWLYKDRYHEILSTRGNIFNKERIYPSSVSIACFNLDGSFLKIFDQIYKGAEYFNSNCTAAIKKALNSIKESDYTNILSSLEHIWISVEDLKEMIIKNIELITIKKSNTYFPIVIKDPKTKIILKRYNCRARFLEEFPNLDKSFVQNQLRKKQKDTITENNLDFIIDYDNSDGKITLDLNTAKKYLDKFESSKYHKKPNQTL